MARFSARVDHAERKRLYLQYKGGGVTRRTETEVAAMLGISPSTLSSWKSQYLGSPPAAPGTYIQYHNGRIRVIPLPKTGGKIDVRN